ncbi:MAG: FtsW/RodA/SpoVE family cell cycle protein [Eubacteriales bacterium]
MIGIMVFFTLISCILLFRQQKEHNRILHGLQMVSIFAYHLVGFLTITFQKDDPVYYFIYAFELILLFAMLILFQTIYTRCNQLLLNNMSMLFVLGSVILARISLDKAIKQFIIMVIAFILALLIPYLLSKVTFWEELGYLYGATGITILGVVLIAGSVTYGSKLSFTIFDITFQPSEIIKVVFVFFLASMLTKADKFRYVVLATIGAALHILILVLSKDLGSAVIYYVAYVFMLYLATRNVWYLGGGTLAGICASYMGYQLFAHVQLRVEAWLNPWADLNDTGYQITQSLFAIGTGGWFGLGLQNGTPRSIPLVETDFVFSAISEEMGAITGICLIIISLTCFSVICQIALQVENIFYGLIAIGIGMTYIFQTFLTIGGGIKFIPLTGVTLPFISYGGTSVLTTIVMFSIVQGVYMIYKEQEAIREAEKEDARRATRKQKRTTIPKEKIIKRRTPQ